MFCPGGWVDDFLYWRDIQGWRPRLEHQALRPLLSGSPGRFCVRDRADDPRSQGLPDWAEVRPAEVVIVEGSPPHARRLLPIWPWPSRAAAPWAERLRRATARDGQQRLSLRIKWIRLEDEFLARHGAARQAGHIVCRQPSIPCYPATEAIGPDSR